jgi:death-on-curing family protein
MNLVPSIDEIVDGHNRFVSESGDPKELVAEANLMHVHYDASRTSDQFKAAARLLHGIIVGHPFYEGNKRTGWASSNLIMERAGYALIASDEETVSFVKEVASYKLDVKEVENWIREHYKAQSP